MIQITGTGTVGEILPIADWNADDLDATLADTDPVASWTDGVGGFVLAQGTSGNRPIFKTSILNGHDVVRFDGSNDVLTNSDLLDAGNFPSSEAMMFIVLIPNHLSTEAYGIVATGSATDEFGMFNDGNGYSAYFRSARINTYPSPMFYSGAHLLTVKSGTGAGNYQIYIDGVGQGTQTPSWGIPSVFKVGQDSHTTENHMLNGDIARIIIYNDASVDRATIEAALMTEYGI